MTVASPDPGSFRDPGNRIYVEGSRVVRAIMPGGWSAYLAARQAGLYERLAEKELLLPSRELAAGEIPMAGAVGALQHPRIPFISYPYEWSYALHRAAALLHLDIHLEALAAGFTLSDASAYNVQFEGTRAVFIDHLSLRPYRDGEIWNGHRQFCMQFLNPLLFWSRLGVAPNHWFRGSLEGIAPEDTAALLSLRHKWSWTVMTHVVAQAALSKRAVRTQDSSGRPRGRLPKQALTGTLAGLKRFISGMRPPGEETVWSDYAGNTSYSPEEREAKRAFVQEMVGVVRPRQLFDLGCNTGDYSEAALAAGAHYVVGFDFDHAALDRAFRRFSEIRAPFLPLWMDAANPSPSQGWGQVERAGLQERASSADALIALALIHHLAIARNAPLTMVVEWIIALAPTGVIEFVPKTDAMVQRLLTNREDIFPDYSEGLFLTSIERHARIVKIARTSASGRLLAWYDRTA